MTAEPVTLDVTASFNVDGWRDPRAVNAAPADPQPQGSHMARNLPGVPYPVVLQENPAPLARWRKQVRDAFQRTGAAEIPADVPVAIEILFRLRKPATVPAARQNEPATRPDIDKLTRAALDALTHRYDKKKDKHTPGAYRDDGQVCALSVRKRYCAPGEHPGAQIRVGRMGLGFSQPPLL